MEYEMGFELVLKAKGKKVIDGSRARALRALEDESNLLKIAARLRTDGSRLRKRLDGLRDGGGRPLVRIEGRRALLTDEGKRVLELYEDRSRFIIEQIRHRYRNPLLTVDGIVPVDDGVVLVRRGRPPFEGKWALPGGIVEYGETVEEAVAREVEEETGLRTEPLRLVGIRSRPDRDPRGHFVSAVFLMRVVGGRLRSGDDASDVAVVPVSPIPELAFDHSEILRDFLSRERSRRR